MYSVRIDLQLQLFISKLFFSECGYGKQASNCHLYQIITLYPNHVHISNSNFPGFDGAGHICQCMYPHQLLLFGILQPIITWSRHSFITMKTTANYSQICKIRGCHSRGVLVHQTCALMIERSECGFTLRFTNGALPDFSQTSGRKTSRIQDCILIQFIVLLNAVCFTHSL